jgi:hypothetical protein
MFTETFPLVAPKGWFSQSLHNATKTLFLVSIAKRQVGKTRITTSWITKGRRQADTALGLHSSLAVDQGLLCHFFRVLKLVLRQGSDTCFHLRPIITRRVPLAYRKQVQEKINIKKKIAKIVPHSCESVEKGISFAANRYASLSSLRKRQQN